MSFVKIRKKGIVFAKKLAKFKRKTQVDFTWYRGNSLFTFEPIEQLLRKGGQSRFFESLPKDRKVLDVGCADGDVAFFMEKQGFKVDVIDHPATNFNDLQGCKFLKQHFDSDISIIEQDIDRHFSLEDDYGFTFAMGLLYHLRNPFYFLNTLSQHSEYVLMSTRIASHSRDGTCIRDIPVSYLVNKDELNNDPTNYWIFSLAGIRRLIERSGFNIICELQVGEVDNSTPHEVEKGESYFVLMQRKENYKDIFIHHHF